MSELHRHLKLYPNHRGSKPGRPVGSTKPKPEENHQEREFTKWTYEKAVNSYPVHGLPRLCFAELVSVFEHRRLCKNKHRDPGKQYKVKRRRGCSECAENTEWVLDDKPGYIFSFVECCNRVGVEVAVLREKFLQRPTKPDNQEQEVREAA